MLDLLVAVVADALGVPVFGVGSTTLRRRELARGSEPDSSFYIQNIDRPGDLRRIDLATDPPPDLVIEIDITSPSVPKLPIYAEFGVPEVWRYSERTMRILVLADGQYVEAGESRALPGVLATHLTEMLRDHFTLDDGAWLRRVRDWARTLEARV
jgi:Uma2 family endonuclease